MLQTTTMTTTGMGMGQGAGMGMTITLDSGVTTGAISTATTMANLPTNSAKGSQQHLQPPQPQQQHHPQLPPSVGGHKNPLPNEAVGGSNSDQVISLKLRSQLEELKHLPQPLGSSLLSHNELDLCKKHNITPTTYLSMKTVCLSGAPSLGSPMETSLRKFFIKCGWLSH